MADQTQVNRRGVRPYNDNLVAHAGGGQAAATPTQEGINRFITVATIADSAVLPLSADSSGLEVIVINAAANSMNVFPAVGEQINALAANAAFAVAGAKVAAFYTNGQGRWASLLFSPKRREFGGEVT